MNKFDNFDGRKNTYSTKWDAMTKRGFESDELLPFWIADMDFKAMDSIVEKLVDRAKQGYYGYTFLDDDYYKIVAGWTKKRYNYDQKYNRLIQTSGMVFSISNTVRLFTEKEDSIMISTPSYPPFFSCVLDNGRNLVTNPLVIKNGRYEFDFEDFERKIIDNNVKWYILCNPHNPTGRMWTKEELESIGNICLKHNVRIINDEAWRDLCYNYKKFVTFPSINAKFENMSITVFSPTKAFNLAGIQVSYVYLPREEEYNTFLNDMKALHLDGSTIFAHIVAREAYENGENWLNELMEYIKANVDYAIDYINKNMKEIKVIKPEATYLLWLDFSNCNIEQINLKLQEYGVALNGGITFGKEYKNFARLNVACPRKMLEEGLEKIKNTIK